KKYRVGTTRINACGDSRLRGQRSRKPIGFRLWVVHVENAKTGKFEDLQDDKDYVVVTNGYIAKGKDGYKTFGKIQGKDTFIPDAQSFIKFLQMHKNFKTYTDSNVIFHFDENNEVKTK
ncbi:5'-nucleotidase C-terminal domain-containing protein, partial [uncultured Sneathia sp.]|uniref:5'-nucleotidase C-terminal domain-containing protein n=1 Tax=uncultured Sneathia sp. TaxID=278067 RepID=UPI002598087C